MKTINCDICKKKIDINNQKKSFEFKSSLLDNERYPFRFKVEIISFEFLTTDFDVCNECLLKAIVNTKVIL